MGLNKIINLFKRGNCCVVGLRGKGKDLLIGNVIARRKATYISNLFYGGKYEKLNISDLNINNTYKNLNDNNINKYIYPYTIGADIYISDSGIYLPSQYCNELNKEYKGLAMYQALSRQISHNNIHFNTQNLNRMWDKVREQSDIYILCKSLIYIKYFNIVIQKVYIYDKYQSCVDRVPPCPINFNLFDKNISKTTIKLYKLDYKIKFGNVKKMLLIYKNKSKHNTFALGEELLYKNE